MTDSILPANSTRGERAIESATARASAIPTPLRLVKRPAECPRAFLPWLAWECSVDGWNPEWTEAQRRAAIAAAHGVHRVKGTAGAIKRALNAIGYRTAVVEWFEHGGDPYTFRVEVEVEDRGITEEVYRDAEAVALATKNVRSHLSSVRAVGRTTARVRVGTVTTSGEVTSVYPYSISAIEVRARTFTAAAMTSLETTGVYPRQ